MVLFVLLYGVVLTFSSVDQTVQCVILWEATKQYCSVVSAAAGSKGVQACKRNSRHPFLIFKGFSIIVRLPVFSLLM